MWWTDRVHLLLIEGNVFDPSISGRHRGARQPIWLTDYAPLCLRHMYVLTAPFVWRIILYFSTVLQTHIVAWLPYLVDGLYFTLSQTHVLTAQGKTAQTMGLVSKCLFYIWSDDVITKRGLRSICYEESNTSTYLHKFYHYQHHTARSKKLLWCLDEAPCLQIWC